MKIDGQEVACEGGTLELETSDMDVAERVLEAMKHGEPVLIDNTEYYPVSVDVQIKKVVVPDTSGSAFPHKYARRPVATITVRA